MKKFALFILTLCALQTNFLCAYNAQKNGILLTAKDYFRYQDEQLIEVELSSFAQTMLGDCEVTGRKFVDADWRPVKISVTNTTDKPMILASSYGRKTVTDDLSIVMSNFVPLRDNVLFGISLFSFSIGLSSLIVGSSERGRAARILSRLSRICWGLTIATGVFVGIDLYAFGEWSQAVRSKLDELNFNDEVLILPGQTITKLLLCKKDEYITRFPLVVYPLENRQDMIVFDVDLRS